MVAEVTWKNMHSVLRDGMFFQVTSAAMRSRNVLLKNMKADVSRNSVPRFMTDVRL